MPPEKGSMKSNLVKFFLLDTYGSSHILRKIQISEEESGYA